MRIRRLTVGEVGIDLELHPRITVLRGLTAGGRASVIEGLQRFLRGQPGSAGGVLEIDGAEFDIEPDVLDLLDLPPDVPDIVIRAADLKRVLHPADEKGVTTFGRGAELEQELDRLDGRLAALAERRTELADEIEPSELRERAEAATAITAPDADGDDESQGGTDERIAEIELEIAALKARLAELDGESAGRGGVQALDVAASIDSVPVAAAFEAFQWVRSWEAEPLGDAVALADRIGAHRRESTVTRSDDVPEWLRAQARQQLDEALADVEKAERHVRPQQLDAEDAALLERVHAEVDEAEERAHRRLSGPIAARRLAAARAQEEEILQRLNLPSFAAYLLLRASSGNVDPDGERHLASARAALADAEAMWAEVNATGEAVDADAHRDEEQSLRAEAVGVLGPEAAAVVSDISLDRLETLLRERCTPAPDWKPAAFALVEALGAQDVYVPSWSFDDASDYEALENLAAAWLREATTNDGTGEPALPSVDDDTYHEQEQVRAELLSEIDRLVDEVGALRRSAVTFDSTLVADTEPLVTHERSFEIADGDVEPEVAAVQEPGRRLSAAERLRQLRSETEARFDTLATEVSELAVQFGEALEGTEVEQDDVEADEFETDDFEADEFDTDGPSPAAEELAALDAEAAEVAAQAEQLAAERDELVSQAADPADAVAAYLTGRFEALREVGGAGSLPALFDGIGDSSEPAVTDAVLGFVTDEPAVQVLLLSDDPGVEHWARQLGIDDASVIDIPVDVEDGAEDDRGDYVDGDPADPDSGSEWS